MPCHSITGLRQFYNYFSSITYYLIIGAFLATLCFYDIFPFHVHVHTSIRFHVSHQIHVSRTCLYILHFLYFPYFMPLTYGISYTYTYTGILMYSHIIHVFLFLYESNLNRNWNHSNRIIQTQVMAFSCQLVGLPILPRDSLQYSFSSALSPYLTLFLCTPLKLRC